MDRVPLGLSLYHVHAADTDVIRLTLYSGGRRECDESAHADDAAADQQGGTDGTYQYRDVKVAGVPLVRMFLLMSRASSPPGMI